MIVATLRRAAAIGIAGGEVQQIVRTNDHGADATKIAKVMADVPKRSTGNNRLIDTRCAHTAAFTAEEKTVTEENYAFRHPGFVVA